MPSSSETSQKSVGFQRSRGQAGFRRGARVPPSFGLAHWIPASLHNSAIPPYPGVGRRLGTRVSPKIRGPQLAEWAQHRKMVPRLKPPIETPKVEELDGMEDQQLAGQPSSRADRAEPAEPAKEQIVVPRVIKSPTPREEPVALPPLPSPRLFTLISDRIAELKTYAARFLEEKVSTASQESLEDVWSSVEISDIEDPIPQTGFVSENSSSSYSEAETPPSARSKYSQYADNDFIYMVNSPMDPRDLPSAMAHRQSIDDLQKRRVLDFYHKIGPKKSILHEAVRDRRGYVLQGIRELSRSFQENPLRFGDLMIPLNLAGQARGCLVRKDPSPLKMAQDMAEKHLHALPDRIHPTQRARVQFERDQISLCLTALGGTPLKPLNISNQ